MAFFSGDYYQRLRLPRNASRRDIKMAFRRLARQHHPDLHPHQPNAAAKFHALREAYEVLIDRVQRQRYDQAQEDWHQASANTESSAENSSAENSTVSKKDFDSRSEDDGSTTVYRPYGVPLHPKTAVDFYIRGIRYALDRRYRAAISDYSQAIALDSQFSEAYLRRAEVLYLLKDDSGVLDNCQQAIYLNSTEAKTYYFQGLARYRLGYVQSAIAAFTNAIACDPDDARYYARRGIAHRDLNEKEAAAKDLRRAAKLYRAQGDIANYQQLQTILKPMGTAGRSWPVKAAGNFTAKLSRLWPKSQKRRSQLRPSLYAKPIPRQNPQRSSRIDPRVDRDQQARIRAQQSPLRSAQPSSGKGFKKEKQRPSQYWAPGVSSRPTHVGRPHKRYPFDGFVSILKLLSNPAGEMVPLYHRFVSARQANLVGYGLAVLANLCFVLGATQKFNASSWLDASRFWAAGGLMFVAMVLVVCTVRACLRIRGLWSADIFILGTTMVPLGLFAVASAVIPMVVQPLPVALQSPLALTGSLIALLWSVSHAAIALRSGLHRIQTFSEQSSAWFAPAVLGIGLGVGFGTWQFLSNMAA
ncbi:MAG: DnaJ domain-containing protein [Cyanobacteria bacterium J06649_4]